MVAAAVAFHIGDQKHLWDLSLVLTAAVGQGHFLRAGMAGLFAGIVLADD